MCDEARRSWLLRLISAKCDGIAMNYYTESAGIMLPAKIGDAMFIS